MALRKAIFRAGLRGYRVDVETLPGRPDVLFTRDRVAIFCDGDFWHGRELATRVEKLSTGHNAPYWVAKIQGNVARDRRRNVALEEMGWTVLRFWESDILKKPDEIAQIVLATVQRAR